LRDKKFLNNIKYMYEQYIIAQHIHTMLTLLNCHWRPNYRQAVVRN